MADKMTEHLARKSAQQSRRCRVAFTGPGGDEVYSLWCVSAPPDGGRLRLTLLYDHTGLPIAAGWKATIDGAEHAVESVTGKEIVCVLVPH